MTVSSLPTGEADKAALRQVMRNLYDLPKMRVQMGNRLVGHFRIQLGQQPGTPTDDLAPEAQKLIAQLKEEYKLFADALTRADPRRWRPLLRDHKGLLVNETQLILTQQYIGLEEKEELYVRQMAILVRAFPVWEHFLDGVRGCGPVLAAVLISELDPHQARHPSSFWRYAGLDLGPDGRGRSKRSEHLITRPYINKDGQPAERQSITYNPFLKTKLMGVLATSFLRSASPYRAHYDDYKRRLQHHKVYGLETQTSDGHRHAMAMRYMIKMFLLDLWRVWRSLEGLDVGLSYAEEKLGHTHGEERATGS
jgi:hypothetical protein